MPPLSTGLGDLWGTASSAPTGGPPNAMGRARDSLREGRAWRAERRRTTCPVSYTHLRAHETSAHL
eukprot:14968318-Alexandrium_andersonii.AAC.1